MAVLIGSARHDENGKYKNGKVGDQLQKIVNGFDMSGEVSIQKFYKHKKGWVILRAKDPNFANSLAFCMVVACNNANIGYNQNNRLGVYKYGVDTSVKTECDCSGLIRACCKQAGHDVPNFTTGNEASVLVGTGLFDKISFTKESDLRMGDVLVTKSQGHTVMVVANAPARTSSNNQSSSNSISQIPTRTLRKGDRGDDVKWLQSKLNEQGANISVDGIFGDGTYKAVRNFQASHGLAVDGIAGKNTYNALNGAVQKSAYPEPTRNLKKGSKGEDVKWVQDRLNRQGNNLAVDGVFGSGTDKAVRNFQKARGLGVDGIVGKNTINALR